MFELSLRVYKSCVELTPQWRHHAGARTSYVIASAGGAPSAGGPSGTAGTDAFESAGGGGAAGKTNGSP